MVTWLMCLELQIPVADNVGLSTEDRYQRKKPSTYIFTAVSIVVKGFLIWRNFPLDLLMQECKLQDVRQSYRMFDRVSLWRHARDESVQEHGAFQTCAL